jgi:polyisoprenoid-binding protein YceI
MNKVLILASLLASPVLAADHYTVDPTHTWPTFEINHLGFSTQRGRFNQSSGKIELDIAARKGSVELTIQTDSLDMGFEKWDQHMKAEGFFDTEIHPTMHFSSQKLRFKGDKVVAAEGDFTMLGVTRPLTLTVSNFRCAPHPMNKKQTCGANVSATLKRSDFGMTKYVPAISDEVKIIVPLEATLD